MTKRKVSNPLALAVLACLFERPMHPYEMAMTMRERGKDQSIKLNYGSLYTVVEALQQRGLIAAQEPITRLTLETPAGLVEVEAEVRGGKVGARDLGPVGREHLRREQLPVVLGARLALLLWRSRDEAVVARIEYLARLAAVA